MRVPLVLSRLQNVQRAGDGWRADCPVHESKSKQAVSVDHGDDGRTLINCFGGCATETIVAALGLTMRDLFPTGRGEGASFSGGSLEHSNTTAGLTVAQYAAAKQIPLDELRAYGLSDVTYEGKPAVRLLYRDPTGANGPIRFRIANEGDKFRWKSGSKAMLYGLWLLSRAHSGESVVLCEGESDCHTLWHHGIQALGVPGADNWKEERDVGHFDKFDKIYVVIEPDRGGERIREWLARSRLRDRSLLVHLEEFKDPSGLHLADPGRFREAWRSALDRAERWTDATRAEQEQAASEAYATARDLLHDPHLLERVSEAMRARGYAGDLKPPTLVYTALTSRLVSRPQNVAVVSPSAAGKNRTVDAATELLPPEAVHTVTAGSARALIYDEADYENKVVIFSEADSIPDDGPAASAVRSLAESNELAYDVVERDEKTGHFQTRHIRKPGPTGLITTSTRSLATQLGTRVLELTLADDADQTRAVMRAHARGLRRTNDTGVDLDPFLALQRWLALAGARTIDVPYAEALAELVPANQVRMRRDFRQLLTCIQAIALLHQCQREQVNGWVIATLDDYSMAHELLAPVFTTIAAEGLTPAVRETVEAVHADETVSEAQLTQRLKLAKATIHYRVNRALKGGWLVNNESRKGQPAKLERGAPLPDAGTALPSPTDLQRVFECSNGFRKEYAPSPPLAAYQPADEGEGLPISRNGFEHSNTRKLLGVGGHQCVNCGGPVGIARAADTCLKCAAGGSA